MTPIELIPTPTTNLTRRAHDPVEFLPGDPRLPEVMLYFGNQCNRDCFFCCVEGSPKGDFRPFGLDSVTDLLDSIQPEARIKLYGGEPTLWYGHVIELIDKLRREGYQGRLTVFSNGVQADRLIEILDSDPPEDGRSGTDTYLNYQIWYGIGVEPIPLGRKVRLIAYADQNPGRVWLSHEDVLPVGAAIDDPDATAMLGAPGFGGSCARCFPTVRSDGRIHACAFAVESDSPHLDLGGLGDLPEAVFARHREFLRWVDEDLEPEALRRGMPPCDLCLGHIR